MQNANDHSKIFDAIRQAVAEGDEIQNNVRDIVVEALANVPLRGDNIREILIEAIQGAREGAKLLGGQEFVNLKQAIDGVDVALAHATEATKLAIEEAVGNIRQFSDQDLQRAFDDIRTLESMFLDTLTNVAKGGTKTVQDVVNEFMSHGKNTGTAVGQKLADSMEELQNLLMADRTEKMTRTLDNAQAVSESIAGIASGLLTGIADKFRKI